MGLDYYLDRDQIQKDHEEFKKRFKNNYSLFLRELRYLCEKHEFYITEVSNGEFYAYQYVPDEPQETINQEIYDAYCRGSLADNGKIERLYFTLYKKI